jgi:hypothetical protein
MATTQLEIVNLALILVGAKRLGSLSDDRKSVEIANDIYTDARNEMFALPYDWRFATTRAELTTLYRMTLDAAPASAWSAGDTITGVTSGETSVIVSVESTTSYLIDTLSDDYTDGENLTNGTGEYTGATGYPDVDELEPICGYDHQYALPSDCLRIIGMVDEDGDEVEYEYTRELLMDAATTPNEIDILATDQSSDIFIKYIRVREHTTINWPPWFIRLVALNLALYLCVPLKQDKLKENQLMVMFRDALKKAVEANGLTDVKTSDDDVDLDRGNREVLDAGIREVTPKYYIRTE